MKKPTGKPPKRQVSVQKKPTKTKPTRKPPKRQVPANKIEETSAFEIIWQLFTGTVIDIIRASTGYNPRRRLCNAAPLLQTLFTVFLTGQPLSFANLRSCFMATFGYVASCPFQNRFKQRQAADFFREAFRYAVNQLAGIDVGPLAGPLGCFSDVLIYDSTSIRVPPRGRDELPHCTESKAGAKLLVGYSAKSGLIDDCLCEAQTCADQKLWEKLVPELRQGVLYLLDLGFFSRNIFNEAQLAGADVLMRLKDKVKVRIVNDLTSGFAVPIPKMLPDEYLAIASKQDGTYYDLDVVWKNGKHSLMLRLVGYVHNRKKVRWYLTTVSREKLTAPQVIMCYRMRWHVELLFREIKQSADLGRCSTANQHAVRALTYAAMLSHVIVRAIRVQAALDMQVPLEELRPIACLRCITQRARQILDLVVKGNLKKWIRFAATLAEDILWEAQEKQPSRSRQRIALEMGAIGL